ncbi:MAG: glycosyltransferase family 4 protein [Verrucomicrobiales bacterium]|nr:glycosyltransferase family 4 protein [Verrucomicrobiales bacterium]
MRVLLVNPFGHRIGGIEIYLQALAPALAERGHSVAFLHQHAIPAESQSLVPAVTTRWCLEAPSTSAQLAIEGVRAWRPDLVFAHQPVDDFVFSTLLQEWPSLYFAHSYLGVCISGAKCWNSPEPPQPCQRVLGWSCLLHYLPHRCGGRNPLVGWRLFHEQRAVQARLRQAQLVATHSQYVRDEYLRHGFEPDRVKVVPFWVPGLRRGAPLPPRTLRREGALRILFLGRFETVKGGQLLLDALPSLARALQRPIQATLAGEGPQFTAWKARAAAVQRDHPEVRIAFPGWLDAPRRTEAFLDSDVLAVPSAWPEPFGMIGPEASSYGLPIAAFDVGGVREWLVDGVNGHLASGAPVSVDGLATALQHVLADPQHYRQLSAGGATVAARFEREPHLTALEALLQHCVERRPAARSVR